MQCAFEETSFSLESWTDSVFLIFSVVDVEVGLIVTFLNQVCKNSCDSVLFADFVSSMTTASLCWRCWSFQSEMWKCSAQADRCLFSKQLGLFREFGSSWLCVYYSWSFSFRWSDPNLKRDWLVFVGSKFIGPCRALQHYDNGDDSWNCNGPKGSEFPWCVTCILHEKLNLEYVWHGKPPCTEYDLLLLCIVVLSNLCPVLEIERHCLSSLTFLTWHGKPQW